MKSKRRISNMFLLLLVVVLCILWLLPMIFVILTSIKSNADFYGNQLLSLPSAINWENFIKAASRGKILTYMKNSLIVVIMTVPIGIFVEAMAAFSLAKLKIAHANGIFAFILVGMMIPMQCLLIPLNLGLSKFGLINSHVGLAIVYIGINIPFGTMVMRGAFKGIPTELDEAGRLDGCNNFQLFMRVLLPCVKPALSTLVILQFLSCWNELLFSSLFVTKTSLKTISSGILTFFGEQGTEYPLLCAAVLEIVIPVMIVYLIFQRYFVEGISGAVKG